MKTELREKLTEMFANETGMYSKMICEYIVWQLSVMKNEELANTTAEEIIKGVFSVKNIYNELYDYAYKHRAYEYGKDCGCAPPDVAVEIICKKLHINEALSDEEKPKFTNPFGIDMPNSKSKNDTSLNLDLDALFD